MILEGLVTTISDDGQVNLAPMGPVVDQEMTTLVLRPFQSSATLANLMDRPEGVFHVTDDVLLLAQSAIGTLDPLPEMFAAEEVAGQVVAGSIGGALTSDGDVQVTRAARTGCDSRT